MDEAKLEEILDRKLARVNEQLLMMNHRLQETIDSTFFEWELQCSGIKTWRARRKQKIGWPRNFELEKRSSGTEVFGNTEQARHEQATCRAMLKAWLLGDPKGSDLEFTDAAVVKMAECIDVELEEIDISTSHRLPMRKKTSSQSKRPEQPPAIIVKFISRDKWDELYRARSKLKNLTSADLGYRGTANKLFISESLTRYNKELFGKCLEARRRLGYKFIWTQQGRIYLRKEYNDPVIHVGSMSDIDTKL